MEKKCKHVRYSVKQDLMGKQDRAKGAYQPMIVLPRLLKKMYGYGVYHRERSGAF